MPKHNIKLSDFQTISREWTALDDKYDNLFQDFLDHPQVKTSEEILKFKTLQKRLYEIELELYKVAEGSLIIEE